MLESDRLQKRFGENLRQARRVAEMSQEELSRHSSVHQAQISAMERGMQLPSLAVLLKLCAALYMTPNDLLDGIKWEQHLPPQGTYRVRWTARG